MLFLSSIQKGNQNDDACSYTPSSGRNGIVNAASDSFDSFASFSNYGSCVDLIAPGVDILSTSNSGGSVYLSGTSMSTPHVAGVMALLLKDSSLSFSSMSDMKLYILNQAALGVVSSVPSGTPNRLLHYANQSPLTCTKTDTVRAGEVILLQW